MAVVGIDKGLKMAEKIQEAIEKTLKPAELTEEMKKVFMETNEPVIYGKLSTYDGEGKLVSETPYPVRQFCEDYLNGKIAEDEAEAIRERLRIESMTINTAVTDSKEPCRKTIINILGTQWEISKEEFDQPELKGKNRSGYCFYCAKRIVIEDLSTDEAWKDESEEIRKNREDEILRHEIIHAFLDESGLSHCSAECDAWAVNEEMVDWLALQSPKIYKVFSELDIL